MIITDGYGRKIDTANLTGGGDPTTPNIELDPRRLASMTVDPGAPARLDGPEVPNRAAFTGVASRAALVDTEVLDRILARPMWHGHRTPEPVTSAWAGLEPQIDRLLELGDDALHLTALERQDEQEAEQAAYEAVSAGKRPPKPKAVDREPERKAIAAEAAGVLRHLRNLRRRYDAVVKEHAEAWRESLIGDYPTLQPAARVAWHNFSGALGSWQSRQMVLAEMNRTLDSEWSPYRSNELQRLLDDVAVGMAAIGRLVAETDANVSGGYVCDPLHTPQPVWWRRERWLSGDPVQRAALAAEEASEGYAVTRFTAPEGQV
ncbi:MAG: hypothetical protein WKF86_09610 [Acidimicrobiales bacterium]